MHSGSGICIPYVGLGFRPICPNNVSVSDFVDPSIHIDFFFSFKPVRVLSLLTTIFGPTNCLSVTCLVTILTLQGCLEASLEHDICIISSQGKSLTGNDANVVFQTGFKTSLKCENCNQTGHTKAICWAKDGGQEGQYPDWFKGKEKVNMNTGVNKVADTHIVWAYGSETQTDVWYADSAATVHVCTNQNNFSTYLEYQDKHTIRTFGKDEVYGIGEGDIDAEVEFQGKITRIKLTNVMHVPGRTSNILSLKILDQRGFESQMAGGRLCILKKDTILTKTPPGREQYEVNLKIHKPEVLATVQKAGHISDLEPCQHLRTNDGPDTSPIDENKWLPAVAMLVDDGTYVSAFCSTQVQYRTRVLHAEHYIL